MLYDLGPVLPAFVLRKGEQTTNLGTRNISFRINGANKEYRCINMAIIRLPITKYT